VRLHFYLFGLAPALPLSAPPSGCFIILKNLTPPKPPNTNP